MKRDSRGGRSIGRLGALTAGLLVATAALLAGCTSVAGSTADGARTAVTSNAATPSHASASNTAAGATAIEPTNGATPARTSTEAGAVTSTPGTPGGPVASHTGVTAHRSTAGPTHQAVSTTTATATRAHPPAAAAATTAPTTAPKARQSVAGAVRTTGTARQPPKTPVAPPQPGNINQTVPAVAPATLQAPALTATARAADGVAVQVTNIAAVTTEARFPGEIAGPGLAVTVRVVNSGSTPVDLEGAIVDLRGANGERGIEMSGGPSSPFAGSVAPGGQAVGVYVFTIPEDQRNPISVRFSYSAQAPTVLFAGDAQ